MRSLTRVLGACAFAVIMTATGGVLAGDPSTAEHLFRQGLDAMKRNQFKEACDAFGGSNEADPSPGTEINLALCNEKQGKLASAWGWYRTAAGLADQRGQRERAELARAEAAKLEPKLHKLVVSVRSPAEGMTVTRNGAPVPSATLGSDVPIDAGDHVVEVTARGKKPWKQTVRIPATPGIERLEVPPLEDAPVAANVAAPAASSDYRPPVASGSDGSAQRTVGLVLGGAGILALVTAGGIQIFNLAVTNRDYEDLKDTADAPPNNCNAPQRSQDCPGLETAIASKDDARKANQLASIVVGAGGAALLVTGIVLYATAPSGRAQGSLARPRIVPLVGRDQAGLALGGTF